MGVIYQTHENKRNLNVFTNLRLQVDLKTGRLEEVGISYFASQPDMMKQDFSTEEVHVGDGSLGAGRCRAPLRYFPTLHTVAQIWSLKNVFEFYLTDKIVQMTVDYTNLQGKCSVRDWTNTDPTHGCVFGPPPAGRGIPLKQ